jgi:hypothetical protein
MSIEIFHALVFWLPAFFFSTTVHEAAHAWAALRGGDPTAWNGGLVSLSPLPHMRRSPLGMVIVPLVTTLTQGLTMGWASAPYDRDGRTPSAARRSWRRPARLPGLAPWRSRCFARGRCWAPSRHRRSDADRQDAVVARCRWRARSRPPDCRCCSCST